MNHHHREEHLLQDPALEEQRRVHRHQGPAPQHFVVDHLPEDPQQDARVRYPLERALLPPVGEHDCAQRRPVERAVRPEDVRPEGFADGPQHGCALGDLARDEVGVDDDDSAGFEETRDGGLPAGDAAGEADDVGAVGEHETAHVEEVGGEGGAQREAEADGEDEEVEEEEGGDHPLPAGLLSGLVSLGDGGLAAQPRVRVAHGEGSELAGEHVACQQHRSQQLHFLY